MNEARHLYAKWCDEQGIHSNRFPSWDELDTEQRDEWVRRLNLLEATDRLAVLAAPAREVGAEPREIIDRIRAIVDLQRDPHWAYRNTVTSNRNHIREMLTELEQALASPPSPPVGRQEAPISVKEFADFAMQRFDACREYGGDLVREMLKRAANSWETEHLYGERDDLGRDAGPHEEGQGAMSVVPDQQHMVPSVRHQVAPGAGPSSAVGRQEAITEGLTIRLDSVNAGLLRATIGDVDAEDPITLFYGDGVEGPGLYVWLTEYPDEGSIMLAAAKEVLKEQGT